MPPPQPSSRSTSTDKSTIARSTASSAEPELHAHGYQILALSTGNAAHATETDTELKVGDQLLAESKIDAAKAFGLAYKVDQPTLDKLESYHISIRPKSCPPQAEEQTDGGLPEMAKQMSVSLPLSLAEGVTSEAITPRTARLAIPIRIHGARHQLVELTDTGRTRWVCR